MKLTTHVTFGEIDPGGTDGVNSFNTHNTILAAGGAIGMAFERRNGQLRIETEGMGRNSYFGPVMSVPDGTIGLITASNWSVMENIWRDFMFNDRFGIYGGGGAVGPLNERRVPLHGGSLPDGTTSLGSGLAAVTTNLGECWIREESRHQ